MRLQSFKLAINFICIISFINSISIAQNQANPIKIGYKKAQKLLDETRVLCDSSSFKDAEPKATLAYSYFKLKKDKYPEKFKDAIYLQAIICSKLRKDSLATVFIEDFLKFKIDPSNSVSLEEAKLRYILANNKYKENKTIESIKQAEISSQIFHQLEFNTDEYINCLLFLAKRYNNNKQFELSISTFERILEISKKEKTINAYRIKSILFEIGRIEQNSLNFQNAILNYDAALQISETNDSVSNKKLQRNIYLKLGECYRRQHQFEYALEYFIKGKELINQFSKEETSDLIYFNSNIAEVYKQQNNYSKAFEYFNQNYQLAINNKWENEANFGWIVHELGKYYLETKDYQSAYKYFKINLDVFLKHYSPDNPDLGGIHLYLARTLIEMGEYESAIQHLNEDIRLLKNFGAFTKKELFFPEFEKARAYNRWYAQSKNLEIYSRCKESYEIAAKDLITELKDAPNYGTQKKIMERAVPMIELYIEFLNTENSILNEQESIYETIWKLSESLHSSLMYSNLQEKEIKQNIGIDSIDLAIDSSLNVQISDIEVKRNDFMIRNKLRYSDSAIIKFNSSLNEKKNELTFHSLYLENKYPNYKEYKNQLQPISIETIRKIIDTNQCILEFFNGDSTIYVFIIKRDFKKIIKIKKDFPMKEWIDSLHFGISGYYISNLKTPDLYNKTIQAYNKYSFLLYDKLLSPLLPYLTKELIIIPDDQIASIPMDCLISEIPKDIYNFSSYQFLAKKYVFNFNYSGSIWHQLKNRNKSKSNDQNILALAPFYTSNANSIKQYLTGELALRYGLCELPYSGQEALDVVNSNQWNNKLLLAESAIKDSFVILAGHYQIIHLATHAIANIKDGQFSFLAFNPSKSDLNNSLLTVSELYNMKINANLITLSACETAIGSSLKGEGVISLARAFTFAGAKSIVASLWRINDQSSMLLMNSFYKELNNRIPIDRALFKAKNQYLITNKGRLSHPFYWAGFISFGDQLALQN